MQKTDKRFEVRLARDERDRMAAFRLRYEVFVAELGAHGPTVDHAQRLERDAFDDAADHLILVDRKREAAGQDHVIGVYRMMTREHAARAGGFYSAGEYDLAPLLDSGRPLLEVGRSCVHADYRGGTSMYLLWNGLARYVLENDIEILFGVASFHGTDVDRLAEPLAYLHHFHLAPPALRVRALPPHAVDMNRMPAEALDRIAALRDMPALIKAYLRLGGFVGQGAYVDHDFNTTDVCLLMDTAQMNAKSREIYVRKAGK